MERAERERIMELAKKYEDIRAHCDVEERVVLSEIQRLLAEEKLKFGRMVGGLKQTDNGMSIEEAVTNLEEVELAIRKRLESPRPNFGALFDREMYDAEGRLKGLIDPNSFPEEAWIDLKKPE